MIRATLKDLWAKKVRLFTTSIAVLLGVAFMSGTLVLTDTVGKTFDDLFRNVNAGTDEVVRAKTTVSGDFGDQRPRVDDSLVATVAKVPGVALARGDILGYAQIVGKDGKALGNPNMGAPTFGGAWNDDALNPYTLREGHAPVFEDDAVIDRKSAKDGDLAIGDRTTIITPDPIEVTIVGIATFGSIDSAGGSSFVGMSEAAAQRYFGEPGKFDGVGVIAADGVSQTELKARIAKVIPDDTEVITGAELTAENQSDMKDNIGFFKTFLLTFALVALFVGSFIIYNTFGIIVAQRTRELALFRALGASRRQVLRSVLLEAALVGIIASGAGLVVGIGVAVGLKALLDALGLDIPAGGIVLTMGTVITAFVTGTLVAVASSFLPARRASKVAPIAAMREVAIDRSATSTKRTIWGVVLLAVGIASLLNGLVNDNGIQFVGIGVLLIFIGVSTLGPVIATPVVRVLGAPLPRFKGMTGVLARENALRNPKRTSATAAALMIGVALVGFITVFASSAKASINSIVDDRFKADLIVDSGSFGGGSGLPVSFVDEVRKVPEVNEVSGVRAAEAKIDGKSNFIFGFDPATISEVYDVGVLEGSFDDLGDGTMALQKDWAKSHDKTIGDTVDVQLVQGGVQQLTVKMIYEDNVLATNYFIPLAVYDKGVPDATDAQVYMTIDDGVPPAQARAAVEKVAQPYPTAKVQDLADFKKSQSAQFNVLLGLIYVLLLLAIIIALLGIANTLALSVFERTRELGLLRAVGMSRRQVRSSIRWESIVIALLGTALGLAIGLFFGWVMSYALKDQGFNRFSVPINQLVVIAVLAAIAGVIAAIWPARRASRLDVLAAIATE